MKLTDMMKSQEIKDTFTRNPNYECKGILQSLLDYF